MDIEQEFEKYVEEVELVEKWEVGVVYHQDFGGGEISYFRADSLLKNKRWKGMSVDEYGGKQKKPRNITADEKVQGWKITPKDKIPKGLKEEVEEARTYLNKKDDDEDKKKRHFAFGGKKKEKHGKSGYRKGEEVDEAKSKLPPHLAKFFDKDGNLKKDAAARVAKGKEKINWIDVTPKGYGPKEEVEKQTKLKEKIMDLEDTVKQVIGETNKNDKSDDGDGLDAVQPKAVKKKFKDRKDKDIDNDGDVDSSDKFLHKKRKAISKAISKEQKTFSKMFTHVKSLIQGK